MVEAVASTELVDWDISMALAEPAFRTAYLHRTLATEGVVVSTDTIGVVAEAVVA